MLVCLMASSGAKAFAHSCTQSEAKIAEEHASSLKDWDAVHRAFRRYAQCDDGAIGEGYSEAVSRLLADHWLQTGRAATLSRNDVAFRSFIVRHVDDSVPADRLARIRRNAQTTCPVGARALCLAIANAAR
jgi:hypothetical protein